MKIAVSVLANDDHNFAAMVEGCRNTWAKNCPENTKVYFNYGIRYMNTHGIEVPEDMNVVIIEPDIMVCNSPENYHALLQKTIMSFDALLQIDDYDYIVRPNCGSYVNLELLNEFLQDKPRNGYYAGVPTEHKGVKYASGACMIFSRDVVQYLVENSKELEYDGKIKMDDVAIGDLLNKKYDISEGKRVQINNEKELEEQFDPNVYHYYYRSTRNPNLHYKVHKLFKMGVKV
tara:strand:- start:207 stop:902 length:696 start_codon:yes stop_codon:yes gene_type:complete